MIHPTAIVSPKAKIGDGVSIGPYSIIHDEVRIGDQSNIGAYCEIGIPNQNSEQNLFIGPNSLIRSHNAIYSGSKLGSNLVTGHHVTIREKTIAGDHFQVGTLGDIQGHCTIGNFVKFHSNVHIGQGSVIQDYVWIFPYVVLTNDPHPPSETRLGVTIESFAAIATMSVILPGVTVSEGALVAANSSVHQSVPPHTVVGGVPAKFICKTSQIKLKDGSGKPAYPWKYRFHRGYPPEVISSWLEEFNQQV